MTVQDTEEILKVYKSKDYSDVHTFFDLEWKRNLQVPISKLPEFNFIRDLINKDLRKMHPDYLVSDFITILEYNKGDFFGRHRDGPSYESKTDITILSGGYILNDYYKGGDFLIKNKKINTEVGKIFTFSREVVHEITEVTEGVRYSIHFAVNRPENKKNLV